MQHIHSSYLHRAGYFVLLFTFLGCTETPRARTEPVRNTVDFVVAVGGDQFVIRLTSPELIAIARARITGTMPQGIVSGTVSDEDGGYNRDPNAGRKWTWHLRPETIAFPFVAPHSCRGGPSDVENNKPHWLSREFCPWSAQIIAEGP